MYSLSALANVYNEPHNRYHKDKRDCCFLFSFFFLFSFIREGKEKIIFFFIFSFLYTKRSGQPKNIGSSGDERWPSDKIVFSPFERLEKKIGKIAALSGRVLLGEYSPTSSTTTATTKKSNFLSGDERARSH